MDEKEFVIVSIVFVVFLIGISKFISNKYSLPFVVAFGLVVIIQGTLVMLAIPFMDMSLARARKKWLENKNL